MDADTAPQVFSFIPPLSHTLSFLETILSHDRRTDDGLMEHFIIICNIYVDYFLMLNRLFSSVK
jgi:hypothetical protein